MALKNLRQESKTAIETKISNSGLKDIKPKAEPRQKRESRGRPPKAEDTKLNKIIPVGLAYNDFVLFSKYCDSAGVSVSTKVRELVIKYMNQNGIK